MRWKEWISVQFVFVVEVRPHKIARNEENILAIDRTWMRAKLVGHRAKLYFVLASLSLVFFYDEIKYLMFAKTTFVKR